MSLHNHLERIAAQERATGVSRLGGPTATKEHLMDIEAIATAAKTLLTTTGAQVWSVGRRGGQPHVHLLDGAIPALEEAGGVWGEWYPRDDEEQQRSLSLTVDGVVFVAYQQRPAVKL